MTRNILLTQSINQSIKGLKCTYRANCYHARLSWALVPTWVSPFVQDPQKCSWGLGWEESRLSRYDIRAEGALPHSIIDTEN